MNKPSDMNKPRKTQATRDGDSGAHLRERLLAGSPVTERRLEIAGVSTPLLEGGDGPPMILLHGPGGHAASWVRVFPALVTRFRVIAPDLPGQGESVVHDEQDFDESRALTWLEELIGVTCSAPPIVVGHAFGASIAARMVAQRRTRLASLVMVDAMGFEEFRPSFVFGQALGKFFGDPNADNHDGLWQYCAHDLDSMRTRMGELWHSLKAYNLDRARAPRVRSVQHQLIEKFGFPPIPDAELARIDVPTRLIWGRHDLATPLSVAQAASQKYGWPLFVIDDCADDPAIEQPEQFVAAVHRAVTTDAARPAAALV